MFTLLLACGGEPEGGEESASGPTYYRDAKPILDAHCANCHQPGDIGPFPLTTYAEASAVQIPLRAAVEAGTMPPWQGSDGCNEYKNDTSLGEQERKTLIDWVDAGALEGDPSDAPDPEPLEEAFVGDLSLALPEPYTPQGEPDDYRCQIIEWPLDEPAYVVGLSVLPDQRQLVHHTIVFGASAEAADSFRALDEAEEGPGYTCFGGPTGASNEEMPDLSELSLEDLLEALQSRGGGGAQRWLGAWVPGSRSGYFPEGTGLLMNPGDILIVQMHYNTSSAAPTPDQSAIHIATADSVQRPAMILPFTDLGWVSGSDLLGGAMTIPAGEPSVMHETISAGDGLLLSAARMNLGLGADEPLTVHNVGHHMHQLGTTGHQEIRHADGTTRCLVDIPRWDFSWQGSFSLLEPVTLSPEDEILLRCSWDNSASNQPVIDGELAAPLDVEWGEGTRDEMCLSTLYLSGP